MVHVNRNYKYANTSCYAVVVFPVFTRSKFFKTKNSRSNMTNQNVLQEKKRILMRLLTSNDFSALLRCQSLFVVVVVCRWKRLKPCMDLCSLCSMYFDCVISYILFSHGDQLKICILLNLINQSLDSIFYRSALNKRWA